MKKLKKSLKILLSVVAGLSCLAFAACGNDGKQEEEQLQPKPHVHSYGEWSVKTPPSCTEKGTRQKQCGCGDTVTEDIAATGHTYSDKWTSDGTYHWHAATCGHDEVADKAVHTNENGVCKICSKHAPTTADTDFEALVSERVDKEGWEKAFSPEVYYNCIVSAESKAVYDDGGYLIHKNILTSKTDGADRFINLYAYENSSDSGSGSFISYYAKYADTGVIEYYDKADDCEVFSKMTFSPEDETYEFITESYNFYNYTAFTPDCGKFYSEFSYNEKIGAYECNNEIITNDLLEDGEIGYSRIIVKIIDGKLAYVYHECGSEKGSSVFYDFDKTGVTLPETYIEDSMDDLS